MATPRLPFLYPNFLRAVRSCEPQTYRSLRQRPSHHKARLHSSRQVSQEAYSSRYGPAAATQSLPPPPKPTEPLIADQQPPTPKDHKEDPESNPGPDEVTHHLHRGRGETHYAARDNEIDAEFTPAENESPSTKELDVVLSVPSPSDLKDSSPRHPHLEASPYEHHFDTYSLVQQLATRNAYSQQQAVTLMKAIRLMLAINLDVAKEGLVSKSDTENEAYLFRAACSELRTTLQTTRHSETLRQRSQRSQLQHESDLLNQKFTQDLITMREELKAMFNERKLGLEEEKRKVDGMIQELNYAITTRLTSEAKSEVEGLRWILTRRAALTLGLCAFMIISALNYSSIKLREREEAEKKRKAAKEKMKAREREMEGAGVGAKYTVSTREMGVQTGGDGGGGVGREESLG